MNNETLRMFDTLDTWRNLPAYQLERRADIFFALFLPGVLESFLGRPIRRQIIPEFPVKRDLIWPDTPSNQSLKVDYLALSEDGESAYLVELKTDAASRRDQQDHYLHVAADLGLTKLLEGYIKNLQNTSAHQKYFHLTNALASLRLLQLPPEVQQFTYPKPKPGLRAQLRRITTGEVPQQLKVVYVQPTGGGADGVIDFDFVATHLEAMESAFAARFALSLRRWRRPAGSEVPQRDGT